MSDTTGLVTNALDLTYENEVIVIEHDRYRVVELHEGELNEYQLTVKYEGSAR